MIVDRIGRDAVRVAVRGHILQPLSGTGVDHAENRTGEHVPRCEIVLTIAGVEPALINTADKVDGGDDGTGSAVDDVSGGSELPAIMTRAGDEGIRAGPHCPVR